MHRERGIQNTSDLQLYTSLRPPPVTTPSHLPEQMGNTIQVSNATARTLSVCSSVMSIPGDALTRKNSSGGLMLKENPDVKFTQIPPKSYASFSSDQPMYVIVFYEDPLLIIDDTYIDSDHSVVYSDGWKCTLSNAGVISV